MVHALHIWFSAFGNYHISRTLQPGNVIFQWSQTARKLGFNGLSYQPTDSGSIAIVGLHRTVYEWGNLTASSFRGPRSFFTRHAGSSCVTIQGDFWPSCNSDVEFLYQCWVSSQGLFHLFLLLLTVLWTKFSTWTVFFATVTLRYNNWSDSAPAYRPGRVYAS